MRVFVTGATGLLGSRVCRDLVAHGNQVVALSRKREPKDRIDESIRWVEGDPSLFGNWLSEIEDVDAVVHLAGESIASGRWTAARKRRLVSSRVDGARLIAEKLEGSLTPKTFVCASAVGYYGLRGDEELDESAAPGDDFLAKLCRQWEAAALAAASDLVRVVCLRFGVILSPNGGALAKMGLPFKLGLGGPMGPAERYFPWVHEDDAAGLVSFALETQLRGPVNVVAPQPVRMGEFASTLGSVLGRPSALPVPLFALRLGLGELADALAPGQRVVPARAIEAGYRFQHPALEPALRDCF